MHRWMAGRTRTGLDGRTDPDGSGRTGRTRRTDGRILMFVYIKMILATKGLGHPLLEFCFRRHERKRYLGTRDVVVNRFK